MPDDRSPPGNSDRRERHERHRVPPAPERLLPGRLVRSRVVTDLGAVLSDALDRRLDGYAGVEPQDALLLDADGAGVLGFRSGVPVGAYHAGTGRGGPAALADLAADGLCRVELRALGGEDGALQAFDRELVRVAAERLAGDQALVARTRRVVDDRRRVGGRGTPAPGSRHSAAGEDSGRTGDDADVDDGPDDPVVAFLEDDDRIAAIREQARERAAEWGLTEQLED